MAGLSSRKFWLFAAAATAAFVGEAAAQQAASTNEDIVVTATRRETRLQDVPVAVTPITAQLLQNSGVRDVQDLTSLAPSLQFNVSENESSATARLRGIGTQGSNPGLESAVGIFIDGVYRARNGVALTDLGELSQVEVLRGPQGTLFGRNTSAGLISIRTAGPDMNKFGADAELTVGDYNERRAEASVTGPIVSDKLAARLFGAISQRDGFMDVNPGGANPLLTSANRGRSEDNTRDVWTVRGQLLWEPTPQFSGRLIVDYSKRDETCCAARIFDPVKLNGNLMPLQGASQTATPATLPFGTGRTQLVANIGGYGPGGLAALKGGNIGDREAFANRSYDQDIEDQGASAEFNWDIGGATLTSVTAQRNWEYQNGQDTDFSQADLYYRPGNGANFTKFDIFTQELRLAGKAGPLDWLVGAFYAKEKLDSRFALLTGAQYGSYFAQVDNVIALGAIGAPVPAGVGTPVTGPTAGPTAPLGALYDALATLPVGSGILGDVYAQDSSSLALFTHNIFRLDDKTDLTIGLRYTNEEKDLKATYRTAFNAGPLLSATLGAAGLGAFANCDTGNVPPAAAATAVSLARSGYCVPWLRTALDGPTRSQSREENEWSGVVSARRTFTSTTSGYLSFSKGYKAGGFNLDRDFGSFNTGGAAYSTAFNPEKVDAYEVGLKNAFMDGDLLLNLAAYYNEYTNFQLNTFNGIQFVVTSVPEVTSQGVELDAIWQTPVKGLSYQGGVSYTEAEYGDDTGWVARNRNPVTGEVTLRWLPGSRLTNAPLWTTTHAFTYRKGLFSDAAEGLAYLDFRYVSDQSTGSDLRASKVQPGYFLVNARLGLATKGERYGVELWARNLTDEEYVQIAFDVPLQQGTAGPTQGAFLGDPRTFGLTLRARY